MTEASYQHARKLMRQLVELRQTIEKHKKSFTKLAEAEWRHIANGDTDLAQATRWRKEQVEYSIEFYKKMYALIQFPPADMPPAPTNQQYCRICQAPISVIDNIEYCTDCQDNQNIPKYDYKNRANKEVS